MIVCPQSYLRLSDEQVAELKHLWDTKFEVASYRAYVDGKPVTKQKAFPSSFRNSTLFDITNVLLCDEKFRERCEEIMSEYGIPGRLLYGRWHTTEEDKKKREIFIRTMNLCIAIIRDMLFSPHNHARTIKIPFVGTVSLKQMNDIMVEVCKGKKDGKTKKIKSFFKHKHIFFSHRIYYDPFFRVLESIRLRERIDKAEEDLFFTAPTPNNIHLQDQANDGKVTIYIDKAGSSKSAR